MQKNSPKIQQHLLSYYLQWLKSSQPSFHEITKTLRQYDFLKRGTKTKKIFRKIELIHKIMIDKVWLDLRHCTHYMGQLSNDYIRICNPTVGGLDIW